jgi:hypothetical protein
MANNLFDIGPLFDRDPGFTPPRTQGLFGFDEDEGFEPVTPAEQRKVDAEFERINTETEKNIERIRDQGLLSRYPVISTPADEKKERARLARRGLDKDEVDRRIAKFKKKGGKVKTSAKVMAAAGMLAGGIQGYLAAKQGRPIPMRGGLTQLRDQAKARMDEEVLRVEKEAQEQKALVLAKDEREFKTFLEEIKADAALRKQLGKEARDLGIDLQDERGKPRPVDDVARDVVQENARRAAARETMEERKETRMQRGEARRQAGTAVTTAIQLRDPTILRDSDIAEHFNIDPKDTAAINQKREQMSGRLRVMSLEEQNRLLRGDIQRELGERKLEEPPAETPEEKHVRKLAEGEIERRGEAMREYQAKMPSLMMGLGMFQDEPQTIQGLILRQAQLLMIADPETYPDLGPATDKVQKDLVEMQKQMQGQGSFVGSQLQRRGE